MSAETFRKFQTPSLADSGLIDISETRGHLDDIKNTNPIWSRLVSSQERTSTAKFVQNLAEVGIALDSLEQTGYVTPNAERYILSNELTKAFEAATEHTLMVTYQAWDSEMSELVGFGIPTRQIYEEGLQDMDNLENAWGKGIEFERERRRVELADALALNTSIAKGLMDTNIKVTISPYPEEAHTEVAREIGYFPERKIAMVRVQEFDSVQGIMITTQMMLDNTDLEAFTQLASEITSTEFDHTLTATEILGLQIYIPKGIISSITDVAKRYDQILSAKNYGQNFFLGRVVENTNLNGYSNLAQKTEEIKLLTSPIISHLVKTDIEIAKSLYQGKPTDFVRQAIILALKSKDKNGASVLNTTKQSILLDSLSTKTPTLSKEAAGILKDFATRTDYMRIICVTDPKRARDLFLETQIYEFNRSFEQNPYLAVLTPSMLTPRQDILFLFCGGMLKIASGQDIYDMTPGQFNNFLKEADAGDGKGPLKFKCKKGHTNTRPFGGTIPYCTTCEESVAC